MESNFIFFIVLRADSNTVISSFVTDSASEARTQYSTMWMTDPTAKLHIYKFDKKKFFEEIACGTTVFNVGDANNLISPFDLFNF